MLAADPPASRAVSQPHSQGTPGVPRGSVGCRTRSSQARLAYVHTYDRAQASRAARDGIPGGPLAKRPRYFCCFAVAAQFIYENGKIDKLVL